MSAETLPSLPLPLISALLCLMLAGLVLRLDPGTRRMPVMLSLFFALLAVQALLITARFAYGTDRLAPVQAVLPLLVGPLLYLGFSALAVGPVQWRRMAIAHLGLVPVVVTATRAAPPWLNAPDYAIAASYLAYALLLLRLWRRGPDALIHARLDLAGILSRWLLGAAGFLAVLLVADSSIAASFAMQRTGQALALITMGSAVTILLLVFLLIALPRVLTTSPKPPASSAAPPEDLAVLEAQARALLTNTKLYLDPDLTVQRLARRLHVPERQLSRAINQTCGMNLSQYVNGFRLNHAATLLRGTDDSVASVIGASGFLTRSNFYREFQRVYGMSPASYRRHCLRNPGDANEILTNQAR